MSNLLDFYRGQVRNPSGFTLEDLWLLDFYELEKGHTFIQWLFPNNEVSECVASSPVLTEDDISEFKKDIELRKKLLRSFILFINFLGFEYGKNGNEMGIWRSEIFTERKGNWLRKGDHNHLRITRMLRSLKLLGLGRTADKFYGVLLEVINEYPGAFSEITKEFWEEAVNLDKK